jgi:hypothetical protein
MPKPRIPNEAWYYSRFKEGNVTIPSQFPSRKTAGNHQAGRKSSNAAFAKRFLKKLDGGLV